MAVLGVLAVTTAGCGPRSPGAFAVSTASTPPTATSVPSAASAPPVSAPPVSASPAVLPRSLPVRVRIPAIGVDSALMGLGLQADGSLEVPAEGFPAGWFTGGPTPGELGPAVLAGHVDWGGLPGVFYRLRDLAEGDQITVDRRDGSAAVFRVSQVLRFAKDAFPTRAVYGNIDHAGLRVITCGGAFDHAARSYVDDLVVFADLVGGGRPAAASGSSAGATQSG